MEKRTPNDRGERAARAVVVAVAAVPVGMARPVVVAVLVALLVVAVAPVPLTQLVDVTDAGARLRKPAHQRGGTTTGTAVSHDAQHGVGSEAHHDADGSLGRKHLHDKGDVDLLGHENRQHLV